VLGYIYSVLYYNGGVLMPIVVFSIFLCSW